MAGSPRSTKSLVSKISFTTVFVALLVAVPLSLMAAVTFGTVNISFSDVYLHILSGPTANDALSDVVWQIRLPRLILATFVGMALATCGVVMQAIVKNPLADPYILGISSGGTLGATFATLLGFGAVFGSNAIGVMAFFGALGSSFLVLFLSRLGGKTTAVKLLLSGLAVGALCGAVSNFVIFLSNDANATKQLVHWGMGSLAGAQWVTNLVIGVVILLGTLFFWTQSRRLNLMLLGDDTAITLGTDLRRWRIGYIMVTSLMIGFSVFTAGMIGFVGLVIPHIVRMCFGTDHKKLLPISALGGALLLIWADVACRVVIAQSEIPIGILTSLIGAPLFVYLLARSRYNFGEN